MTDPIDCPVAAKLKRTRLIRDACLLLIGAGLWSISLASSARAEADTWLKSAPERIARIRQAPVELLVVDAAGRPVPNAIVRVEQRRHAFLFGCNVFALYDYTGSKEQTYAREFSAVFNYATLPFYWGRYEPEPGQTKEEELKRMAAWCKAYGIETKGHPLVWHELYPPWGPADPAPTREALRARIDRIVPAFHGLVDRWDVINEATAANVVDAKTGAKKFDNGESRWIAEAGAAPVVEQCLRWTREANPAAVLVYNDYNLGPEHEALVARLVRDHAPFDVIGIQAHMHLEEWTLEKVWETCETYAKYGKPLHFTEVTVLSGEHGWERPLPWPSTPEGEQRQAAYVAQLYTLLFSHPAVEAITWWDLADGNWQGAPSGLVRADLSPKSAYERLRQLIKESWWTRLSLTTDADGVCRFDGFRGDYEVVVQAGMTAKTATFTLQKGLNTWKIQL
ncbi:MAG: endo-1,4-beta-xylanase [Opitutaceae bacterium]|nr:endo-1,4-beta-xylanase [Opitutaceae bacterium]